VPARRSDSDNHLGRRVLKLQDYIEHTLLKAEATRADVERLCAEAEEFAFFAVCVYGSWISECRNLLRDTDTKVVSVAGFPAGANTPDAKAAEVGQLVELGADEMDVVAPVGRILMGDWSYIAEDVDAVVRAAAGRTVKVILETALLTTEQIVEASSLAVAGGAKFVKTSTGLHPAGGATVEAVKLIRRTVGGEIGVKAAGGIGDRESAVRMIEAGATRIGTSSGVSIVGRRPYSS